ncbi:MAG: type II secretion system protein M [Gammaproteobacteria bacterium]|nr:type II secretion system protein M [Gammaproteobacteria bacterium]
MSRLQEFRQWFLSLDERERNLLTAGGLLLLLVLVYIGILNPYLKSRSTLVSHVREQQALLTWMQPAAERLKALNSGQPAPLPGGSLLTAVNRTAADTGLGNALRQVQQNSDGSVRVRMEGASFDMLVRWLSVLRQRDGIITSDMSVERVGGPGLVNASISLQGPAP